MDFVECFPFPEGTLPETNMTPENRPSQKETIVFQPSIFRDYVSFREGRSCEPLFLVCFQVQTQVQPLKTYPVVIFQPSIFRCFYWLDSFQGPGSTFSGGPSLDQLRRWQRPAWCRTSPWRPYLRITGAASDQEVLVWQPEKIGWGLFGGWCF